MKDMPMKRFFSFFSLLMLLSCSSFNGDDYSCPSIFIPRETSRIYKNSGSFDSFQVNVVGFNAYCYTETANNRRYAVISPVFKVRRLESSQTTNLDIDFYIKTSINDKDYIGKNIFNQVLNIPVDAKENVVVGKETRTRIMNQPYQNFHLDIGMVLEGDALDKSKRMFDIDYKYLSTEEINDDKEIKNVYLEVETDEEVIYSDIDSKPKVVKKNYTQNNCQN